MKTYEQTLLNLLEERKQHNNDSFLCPSDSPEKDNLVILESMGLIEIKYYIDGGFRVHILPPALTYFELQRKDRIRTWIPICISAAALVKSFSVELAQLWNTLMQLLK